MTTISERVRAVRDALQRYEVEAYLVPSADEHLNEYLPPWRLRREFLSGFTGSAGDLLVGREEAWLYVDSRYHLQADLELEGSGIRTVKIGTEEARTIQEHLGALVRKRGGLALGVDPMVLSLSFFEDLKSLMEKNGGKLVELRGNLVDAVWSERPAPPTGELIPLSLEVCGRSAADKLELVRGDLAECGAVAMVVLKLDQIAWMLNLRSFEDIPFNPVFESALHLEPEAVHLFLHGAEARLPQASARAIPGLAVHPYAEFVPFLKRQPARKVLVDPAGITRGVAALLEESGATLLREPSPIEKRKAIKNSAEREAQRRANLLASAAKTRSLLWLRREKAAGSAVTEVQFRDHLEKLYAEQDGFMGLSFTTISAAGPHGAIIHYSKCDDTLIEEGQLFLIDSGAHIDGGTTDATRTIGIGACDDEARRVYTAVLRGHVNAARQRFPDRTPGIALDTLARSPLWREGLDYGHGTGHGVGAFLNVHEGPFSISFGRANSGLPLLAGMVSSIEPGCYRTDWGAVRIENLYLFVEELEDDEGRVWLRPECLTWIPFDATLIDPQQLQPDELRWVEDYQAECLRRLAPLLSAEELEELKVWIEPAST